MKYFALSLTVFDAYLVILVLVDDLVLDARPQPEVMDPHSVIGLLAFLLTHCTVAFWAAKVSFQESRP